MPSQLKISAIEHEPAVLIPQPLVVQHEGADRGGKLRALPLAFQPPRFQPFAGRGRGAGRPDRVGRCAQFVGGHMRYHGGLPGGERCFPCCAFQFAGSAHRVPTPDGLECNDNAGRGRIAIAEGISVVEREGRRRDYVFCKFIDYRRNGEEDERKC